MEIFSNPIVKVGTSFEFGNARVITKNKYLTKNLFLDIIHKFESYFHYRPDFISVITAENISTALDNVRLAKELGVQCKLNYVVKSGKVDCGLSIGEMHHLLSGDYKCRTRSKRR